jgi:hypothetical protein
MPGRLDPHVPLAERTRDEGEHLVERSEALDGTAHDVLDPPVEPAAANVGLAPELEHEGALRRKPGPAAAIFLLSSMMRRELAASGDASP